MTKPSENNIILTKGVLELKIVDSKFVKELITTWENAADNFVGGDDKRHFQMNYNGTKIWVVYTDYIEANKEDAENYPMPEVYTVLLPEEY